MSRVYEALNRVPRKRPEGDPRVPATDGVHARSTPATDSAHARSAPLPTPRSYPHEQPRERVGYDHPTSRPRARSSPAKAATPLFRFLEPSGYVGELQPEKLIVGARASTSWIDPYRRLAVELLDIQARSAWKGSTTERGLKTLLVTSARPREGRTLTAVNLALALSEFEQQRVLLVDADLKRPSIHKLLNLSDRSGLCDALQSPDVVLPLQTFSPCLSVLPAGQPRGAGVPKLTSESMGGVLERCASEFDWILLDVPPVGALTHPERLARLTRAVLFVIGSGVTPYAEVSKAIAKLGHASIVGTVLNKIDRPLPTPDFRVD